MNPQNEPTNAQDASPGREGAGAAIQIGPAAREEIAGIIELMFLRPPAYWMRKLSAAEMGVFLKYAIESSDAVILTARVRGESAPAGYVFSIIDSLRFWAGFLLRNPALAHSIVFHRLKRLRELRRRPRPRAAAEAAAPDLPEFSWSPSRRGRARIIGLYVRKEHHQKGVAMDLYFKLFDALREKGCERVEEYAAPDYAEFAGKFPKVCGWDLQQCSCGGFKISRSL